MSKQKDNLLPISLSSNNSVILSNNSVILSNNSVILSDNSVILSGVWRVLCDIRSRRTCVCFCSLLLAALAAPLSIHAQFTEPTPEELKMTTDPKAPGAAAVYLYREEVSDSFNRALSGYERIKVLTEKGKELATVKLKYSPDSAKIDSIEGRTIHADGTIIPFTEKPSDLVDTETKNSKLHVTVFDLPSVEVGSILEYRYRFVGLSIFKFIKANMVSSTEYFYLPAWWIQQKYFVHKEHFSMMPADKLSTIYTTRLPVGAKLVIDKRGEFSLDMSDIPATPDEDWMPPLNSTKWSVDFAITRSSTYTVKELWEDQSQLWAIHMNYLTSPTSELKKIVAEIIAPIDTDAQKARKIYDAVQKLDNTAFSRVKSETERKKEGLKDQNKIEDIWKQKSGSDDDIAALYVALARSAGLTAWPIAVTDRSRAIFDKNTLTIEQLDDVIAVVVIDGKDVYLDPGQKMCPFGILKWNHSLAAGFRLADKGAKDSISGHKDYSNYIGMRLTNNVTIMDMTPAASYKESAVQQAADLTIDEAGNVKGTARILLSGQDALRWRQLALRNDEEEVKRQFMDELRGSLPDGIQADFDHFDALSDYNAKLVAVVKISGNLGSVTGKHIFLPGLFFESRAKHPFTTQDKRITPVDLHYAKMEQDDVTYHLPDGYTVEGAIKASNISWPDHAMLRYNSVEKPGVLQVQRTFARNFALLEPTAYNDLHDFYLKLAAADQQQIVLTRAAVAAKGN